MKKKCAPTFPIPTFPLSPKCWILTIWANLSQYWPINWLFGQNKSEKYFLLEHSPKHSHRTNLTDSWLLVTPRTLFEPWYLETLQNTLFSTLVFTKIGFSAKIFTQCKKKSNTSFNKRTSTQLIFYKYWCTPVLTRDRHMGHCGSFWVIFGAFSMKPESWQPKILSWASKCHQI